MVKFTLAFLALAAFGSAKWEQGHQYSAEVSSQVYNAIKTTLLNNIGSFTDQTFAGKLRDDLNNGDDGKRTLKEISSSNAAQMFAILKLNDPRCDSNGDGVIKDNEVKCLNYAWKAFVPQ